MQEQQITYKSTILTNPTRLKDNSPSQQQTQIQQKQLQFISVQAQPQQTNADVQDDSQLIEQEARNEKIIQFEFRANRNCVNLTDEVLDVQRQNIRNIMNSRNYKTALKLINDCCEEVVRKDVGVHSGKENQKRRFLRKLLKNELLFILRYKHINLNRNKIIFDKHLSKYVNEMQNIKQKRKNFINKCNQHTKNVEQKIKNHKTVRGIQISHFSQNFKFRQKQQQIDMIFKNEYMQKLSSLQKIASYLKNNLIITNYFNYFDCPGCVSFFQQYSVFGFQPYGRASECNVIRYPNFFTTDKQTKQIQKLKQFSVAERTNLQKALCALFNKKKGYIFIGVAGEEVPFIQGMILTKQLKATFQKQIKKIIKQYIEPQQQTKQIFKDIQQFLIIDYIPVLKNLSKIINENPHLKFHEMPQQQILSIIFEGHYVIRIKVNLSDIYEKYFFYVKTQTLGGATPQYAFFQLKNLAGEKTAQKVCFTKFYQKMTKKYSNKRYIQPQIQKHPKHIKCSKPLYIKQQIKKKLQEHTEQKQSKGFLQNNRFGKAPNKNYNHQSIVIVTNKGMIEQSLEKFKQYLKNKKHLFDCYVIYEGLKKDKTSTRSVFYMTHQKKFEAIQKQLTQFQGNTKKPDIFLFDVRKQLVLLDSKDSKTALDRLQYTFKLQFQANISYGQNKFYNPKVSGWVTQFYLYFFHITYAIFAFIALQYINIRCNFVNNSRLDGVTMHDI